MICCRCGVATDGTTVHPGVRSAICEACSTQPAPPAPPPAKTPSRRKAAPPADAPPAATSASPTSSGSRPKTKTKRS